MRCETSIWFSSLYLIKKIICHNDLLEIFSYHWFYDKSFIKILLKKCLIIKYKEEKQYLSHISYKQLIYSNLIHIST